MQNNMTPTTVRLTVSEILDKRGISTREFADSAGLTYNQALAIRRNAVSRVDFSTLGRICDALGVKPGELLIDAETK